MPAVKLLGLRPSPRPDKKLVAVFSDGTATHFGARGYGDYIRYHARDPEEARRRRRQYLARHGATQSWKDPRHAGTLARYILWEHPTVAQALRGFRRRFGV